MTDVARMWVNQPSAHQTYHSLHGFNVLAVKEDKTLHRVYFLSGDVVSQQISTTALSDGWIPERRSLVLDKLVQSGAKVTISRWDATDATDDTPFKASVVGRWFIGGHHSLGDTVYAALRNLEMYVATRVYKHKD